MISSSARQKRGWPSVRCDWVESQAGVGVHELSAPVNPTEEPDTVTVWKSLGEGGVTRPLAVNAVDQIRRLDVSMASDARCTVERLLLCRSDPVLMTIGLGG